MASSNSLNSVSYANIVSGKRQGSINCIESVIIDPQSNESDLKILKKQSEYLNREKQSSNLIIDSKMEDSDIKFIPDFLPCKSSLENTDNSVVDLKTALEYLNQEKLKDSLIQEKLNDEKFTNLSYNEPSFQSLENVNVEVDKDDTYTIAHWEQCSNDSSNIIKSCRGLIHKGSELVCKTFSWTPEFFGNTAEAKSALEAIWDKPKIIYPACEGTNVRLWFDNNVWHLSTFRRLDAKNSRWGSKISYGELFMNALSCFMETGMVLFDSTVNLKAYNTWKELKLISDKSPVDNQTWFDFYKTCLRTDRIYTFVICSTMENRIVARPEEDYPQLYFTGEFDNQPGSETRFALLTENTSYLPCPGVGSIPLSNPENALEMANGLNPETYQGLIIHYGVGSTNFGSIKLTSKNYQKLADLRGNEPSVKFRYLQLRQTKPELLPAYRDLYPERIIEFNEYEQILMIVAMEIFQGYVARYLKRQFIQLPQEQWYVAKAIHEAYFDDPENNKISGELVWKHLNGLSATRLNYIIKQYKLRLQINE